MRVVLMLLPWLELFTLIQLGIETSALTAVFYVLATLVVGLLLLRNQGFQLVKQLQEQQRQGLPFGPTLLVDKMAIGCAALLLMIPGLISDAFAVVLLIGPLRRRLARWLGVGREDGGPRHSGKPEVDQADPGATTIEGEYRRLDE